MLFKTKYYLPAGVFRTVFDINYNKLYDSGKRIILMDIDNTLIPYSERTPGEKLVALLEEIIKSGFTIIFISNNNKKRVSRFAGSIKARYVYGAMKPFKKGYRQALKMIKPFRKEQVIAIGDQLITDVLGANRAGIDVYLVRPLEIHSEKWFTRFNRGLEKSIMRRIRKHYPEMYRKIEALYEKV